MAELVEDNESAAFDKLRQRWGWPSTSSGSDGGAGRCLRQAQATKALAELAEANESAAFDKLRRRGALAEAAKALAELAEANADPSASTGSGGGEEIAMPYMYILECADGSYYTGSTSDLERRLWQHAQGLGARHTAKHLPVKLVYCENYDRVEDAFSREKQVQGWSRRKKRALIEGATDKLVALSQNYTQYGKPALASTGSANAVLSASTGSSDESGGSGSESVG